MNKPDIPLLDFVFEEPLATLSGGALWRARSAAQNAGAGRADLLYVAHERVSGDVNAGEQLRSQLRLTEGCFHPNLLATYGAWQAGGRLVVNSELVPGVTLAEFLRELAEQGKKLPVPVALQLAVEIAKALCHCQVAPDPVTGAPLGIVHGQVRPENVRLSFGGQVKLVGFGIAELENFALATQRGFLEGAANYVAPERAIGREVDGRSDFFSLGTVLWELLTGRALYPAAKREEWLRVLTEKTPPAPSEANPEVPTELDTVLCKLLDRDLFLRYELGEKAARDLEAVMKFRFPQFTAAEFTTFVSGALALRREAYLAERNGADRTSEATKEIMMPQAVPESPVVAAFTAKVQEPAQAMAAEAEPMPVVEPEGESSPAWSPRRARAVPGASPQPDLAPTAQWLRWGAVAGAALLLVLSVAGPKLLKKVRAGRSPAKARAETVKTGTLHFVSPEKNFVVTVNGKAVEVVDERADVVADRELAVKASLPGYDDIETVTQVSPGEDFDIRLDFHRAGDSADR